MKAEEVRELIISERCDVELPYHIELVDGAGASAYGDGVTLAKAAMSAFSAGGMFPSNEYPYRTDKELARFIFWNFGGGENWVKIIKALNK